MAVRLFLLDSQGFMLILHNRPPPIDISTNDNLVVHVTNSLTEPTSLHHHGIFFNSTSWMDGALGVSQWSIQLSHSIVDFFVDVLYKQRYPSR
jgi:hypothetical protein